jgi:flavin reductase (DIM6/NTAB) family NADH-FMN oxidoreductase RutF
VELDVAALALQERYKLLTALVFPRPIALISTRNQNGVDNCTTRQRFELPGPLPAE